MDKDLLQKHQNDPAWAEVVRLYSGLFDTQDEREDFILDLADKDILLAAECKTSSVEEESVIVSNIEKKISIDNFETKKIAKSMLALLEVQKIETLKSIIVKYKHKRSVFPSILTSVIYKFDSEKFVSLYSVLVSINQRISSKEKKSIREFFRNLISKNIDVRKYYHFLINNASAANITELKKVANELSFDIGSNSNLVQTIKKLIDENKPLSIKQALALISQNNLEKEFDVRSIIKKLLKFNTSFSKKHAKTFISKYNLGNYFSEFNFNDVEKEVVEIIPEFEKKQIIVSIVEEKSVVICTITNIIPSRVFVRIENENHPASIYIGELSNKRINNIFDFEYNGEKLHVGQKLIAKVISIDEQGRINLSLKQVKNG